MKKLSIALVLFSSILWSLSLDTSAITNMISKIKEEREGISLSKLEGTLNPFILVEEKKEENLTKKEKPKALKIVIVEPTYNLEAILNNAVFINKKWYKRGDKLGAYRIGYISQADVELIGKEKRKTLTLKKKKFIKLH